MSLRLVFLTTIFHLSVVSTEALLKQNSSDVDFYSNYSTPSAASTTGVVNSSTLDAENQTTEAATTIFPLFLKSTLESSNSTEEQGFEFNSTNFTTTPEASSEFATNDSTTLSTSTEKVARTSTEVETTTFTSTTDGKTGDNINSKNSEDKEKKVADEKREAERSLIQWVMVAVIIIIGVIIICVAVLVICLKRWQNKKNQSKESASKTGTPSGRTPLKTDKTQEPSVQELRSLKEDQTQPSPKELSDSKSSMPTVRTPDKETKREQKESITDVSKEKPRESIIRTTCASSLLKRRSSTVEYWKEDSKKSLEAVKPTTVAVDDAPFGFSDGSKGGLKLFKADMEEGKVFVETKEMVAQMSEARAALGRKRPRTEITQSSRKKKIAATLRTNYE